MRVGLGVLSNKESDYLKERRCAAALILDSFSCVFSRVPSQLGQCEQRSVDGQHGDGPACLSVYSDQRWNLIRVTVSLFHRTNRAGRGLNTPHRDKCAKFKSADVFIVRICSSHDCLTFLPPVKKQQL